MFEPEIRRLGGRGDHLFAGDLGDEHRDAAEVEVDARPAVGLGRTDYFGAEHPFVPERGLFGVGAAQMDVVIGEGGHRVSPFLARAATLSPARTRFQSDHAPRTFGRRRSRQALWLSLASSVIDSAIKR